MRLIWWVVSLSLGTMLMLGARTPVWIVVLLGTVSFGAAWWLVRRRWTITAEVLVAAAIGAYVGARADNGEPLAGPIAAVVDSDRRVSIEGWVFGVPETTPPRDGSHLRIAVEHVDGTPARAVVALSVANGVPDVWPGDAVRFDGRLLSVRGLANPGLPDAAMQTRAAGIDAFASVGAAAGIRRLRDDEITFPRRHITALLWLAARVRLALGRAIDAAVTGSAATFLHTTVLGERRSTDATVEDGFRAAGATHVLSVSGLHLAAIAMVSFVGVRRVVAAIPRLPLWVDPRVVAALIAGPAIGFYTMVTGGAVATVRSAVMMGVALAGVVVGRPHTPVVSIAAAVLLLLGWSPLVLVDLSFQLSVVSVLALALLVPRVTPQHGGRGRNQVGGVAMVLARAGGARVLRWVGGLAGASVAAGLTTAPLVAHHFGEITPAAPLGNLLLVPLVELVVVPCGLLGAIVGSTAGPTCAWPLLTIAARASRLALAVADLFRTHAPVWLTRAPNIFETGALCLGLGCALGAGRHRRIGGRGRVLGICATVLVVAAGGSLGVREAQRRWSPNVIVTFLDIGQGDAAVVQCPGGHTVLIDGGGTYDGSFDPGARVVEPFLRARGITHLDAVALSHPHPDHMGGLHRILARFPVDVLWTSGDDGHNPDYGRLLAEARARGVATPVPALVRWPEGGAAIEPLGPFVAAEASGGVDRIGKPEGATVNDASLILRVAHGGRAVLFTGDIEANGEGELAGRATLGQMVASDVLKVPHHGSRTSSSDDLLDVVRPRMAVMSLGWRNRFHFPRPEVVARYRERNIWLLRTDLDGAVTVTIDSRGEIHATCERGCPMTKLPDDKHAM